ncbi:MAG TPA: iron uptake transporter permease EfeU [Frankiaceae bacterium]
MLSNYLIGLREGLEASLVVSILIAYLVRTGRRRQLVPVWGGVGTAVVVAAGFGAVLTFTSTTLLATTPAQEKFGGSLSLLAVALVTAMIFWMRRTARTMRSELQGRLDSAIAAGSFAVALTAFFAVGREGLETALFLWSAVQSAGSGVQPLLGAGLGLLTGVALAWLLYRRAVTLNLATFFTWTGGLLIVVAAGVLGYGLHDLQEGGALPGVATYAWNVTGAIPPSSWYGTLLKGIFNFSPDTTVLQAVSYLLYLPPVLYFFFRRSRPATPTAAGTVALPVGAPGATTPAVASGAEARR